MKKRFFAFFLLIAFLVLPALARASGDGNTYVIDECGNLTASQLERLNEKARLIEAEQGITVMFAIIEDSGGSVQGYLERLYEENQGGEKGLILGFCELEKKWNGIAYDSLTKDDIDALWSAYDSADTYVAGITAYLDLASELYAQKMGGSTPSDTAGPTEGAVTGAPVTEAPVTEVPVTAVPVVNGNRVEDAADLLTDEQEAALAQKLEEISRKHDCDVVIITAKSLGRKEARLFAADYYEYCGYSMSGGMVMMVCPEERDYAFVGTGKCYDITKNSWVTYRLKKVVVEEHLSKDEYAAAFNVFAEKSDEFMTNVENGKPPYKENLISTTFAAIVAAIVGLIGGGSRSKRMEMKLYSVEHQYGASDYVDRGSLKIVNKGDVFLYSDVVKTEIVRDDDRSSSSSSSSASFTSSSGAEWSGSSGKY